MTWDRMLRVGPVEAEAGTRVVAGDPLGEVRDAFGVALERPVAPIDGIVLFLVSSLAMNAGDPLLAVAG